MKKNVIGHMMAPKEKAKSRFRRWDILPRLLCLLLAMMLWLLIANAQASGKEDDSPKERAATSGALV